MVESSSIIGWFYTRAWQETRTKSAYSIQADKWEQYIRKCYLDNERKDTEEDLTFNLSTSSRYLSRFVLSASSTASMFMRGWRNPFIQNLYLDEFSKVISLHKLLLSHLLVHSLLGGSAQRSSSKNLDHFAVSCLERASTPFLRARQPDQNHTRGYDRI